jgi:hypothetical protein
LLVWPECHSQADLDEVSTAVTATVVRPVSWASRAAALPSIRCLQDSNVMRRISSTVLAPLDALPAEDRETLLEPSRPGWRPAALPPPPHRSPATPTLCDTDYAASNNARTDRCRTHAN